MLSSRALTASEAATTAGQGDVIRHGQLEPEQAQHTACERLCLGSARWETSRKVSTSSFAKSE